EEEAIVSTARPETTLGDTATMLHPEDPCYTHLHAQRLLHTLPRETIPVMEEEEEEEEEEEKEEEEEEKEEEKEEEERKKRTT
ncbi:hypothetical protein O3P69_011682, partial [Scylla paramamosain]